MWKNEPITRSLNPVRLYNPLLRVFKYKWKDDGNIEHELVMNPGFTTFPEYQANFMKKHLADEIYNTSGKYPKKNSFDDYYEIYKTIEGDV
jgi:hypothetical protein